MIGETIISFSVLETLKIAENIAKNANPGDIFCLSGDLGAGKTHFTKGFAKGLGIDDDITSPTFTLVHEHGGGRLYHFDVYRIESSDEILDLGCDEMFFGNGVCVIEWADKIKDIIPKNAVWITISHGDCENHRVIKIENFN